MAEGDLTLDGTTAFSNFESANLVICQLNNPEVSYFKGSEQPFKGWNCPSYDHMVPAPELNYSLRESGRVVFETLIFPVEEVVDPKDLPKFSKAQSEYLVEFKGVTRSVSDELFGSVNQISL